MAFCVALKRLIFHVIHFLFLYSFFLYFFFLDNLNLMMHSKNRAKNYNWISVHSFGKDRVLNWNGN